MSIFVALDSFMIFQLMRNRDVAPVTSKIVLNHLRRKLAGYLHPPPPTSPSTCPGRACLTPFAYVAVTLRVDERAGSTSRRPWRRRCCVVKEGRSINPRCPSCMWQRDLPFPFPARQHQWSQVAHALRVGHCQDDERPAWYGYGTSPDRSERTMAASNADESLSFCLVNISLVKGGARRTADRRHWRGMLFPR